MARGVNKAIIVGNLGRDPEVRYSASGSAIANVTVATTDSWKDRQSGERQERTEWHRVVFFNRLAEIVAEYQSRLRQRMENLLSEIGKTVAQEDMLKEIAIFAERTDIAEEISRLDGHIEQFKELIDGSDQDPIGRTLDFLAQEMLRESNTSDSGPQAGLRPSKPMP